MTTPRKTPAHDSGKLIGAALTAAALLLSPVALTAVAGVAHAVEPGGTPGAGGDPGEGTGDGTGSGGDPGDGSGGDGGSGGPPGGVTGGSGTNCGPGGGTSGGPHTQVIRLPGVKIVITNTRRDGKPPVVKIIALPRHR